MYCEAAPVKARSRRLADKTMQIVEAVNDARVLDAGGKEAYTLRTGERYVLYDAEAGHGLRDGALEVLSGLDRTLPAYAGEILRNQRLFLPFIGRQGDALVVAACLMALREAYPGITIDIAAPRAAREVFQSTPRCGKLLPYPAQAEYLADYRYYLSLEEVEAIPDGARRSFFDVFSTCLHTPRPAQPVNIEILLDIQARWRLPGSSRYKVALHVGVADSLRTYPLDLTGQLADRLIAAHCEVFLIGADVPNPCPSASDDGLHDLIDGTKTVADLAAVLSQMDLLIAGDSFPMHLAGAMEVKSLALFTSTDAVLSKDYPGTHALKSTAGCSPCYVAVGPCPLGHATCIAHRELCFDPHAITKHALRLLAVGPNA